MLRLPRFEFRQPVSLREAVKILGNAGPEAMLVAGGTDLWPKMKRRQIEPKVVIGLRQLRELQQFEGSPETGLRLGANLTLWDLERHPLLLEHYPALAEAARSISSPPLKSMGTLGGNLCVDTRCNYYDQTYEWRKAIDFCLKKDGEICWVAPGSPRCWAVSSTDLAPVMLAMGAKIRLISGDGEREIAAQDLYKADGIEYLTRRPDEILSEVAIPASNGDVTAFLKLRRRGSIDFSILNVAVWIRPNSKHQVCEEVRIAVGGVTSRPFLNPVAEETLIGQSLTSERIEEAARLVGKVSKPMDNTDLHFSWRHKMVRVWVRRALEECHQKMQARSA